MQIDILFRCRYIYTNQSYLATVHFGLASLSFCIFSLGLSIGVVIAVGMLLYFQVRFCGFEAQSAH